MEYLTQQSEIVEPYIGRSKEILQHFEDIESELIKSTFGKTRID